MTNPTHTISKPATATLLQFSNFETSPQSVLKHAKHNSPGVAESLWVDLLCQALNQWIEKFVMGLLTPS